MKCLREFLLPHLPSCSGENVDCCGKATSWSFFFKKNKKILIEIICELLTIMFNGITLQVMGFAGKRWNNMD